MSKTVKNYLVRLDPETYANIVKMAHENNRKIGAQVRELYRIATQEKKRLTRSPLCQTLRRNTSR